MLLVMRCCIWFAALRASSADGKVDMTSSPMVLMTVAAEVLGRLLHHPQALLNRLPGTLIAEVFIELRAADHVCKQY
jgi:hypothetical protein